MGKWKSNQEMYSEEEDCMTKKEWGNCNTCWTCKYRKIINGHIFCWYNNSPTVLTSRDIINSLDCLHREKEEWRG